MLHLPFHQLFFYYLYSHIAHCVFTKYNVYIYIYIITEELHHLLTRGVEYLFYLHGIILFFWSSFLTVTYFYLFLFFLYLISLHYCGCVKFPSSYSILADLSTFFYFYTTYSFRSLRRFLTPLSLGVRGHWIFAGAGEYYYRYLCFFQYLIILSFFSLSLPVCFLTSKFLQISLQ